jgi:hypothetical protein
MVGSLQTETKKYAAAKVVKRDIMLVECVQCGFDVKDLNGIPSRCPKCHGMNTFTQTAMPGSILAATDDYPEGADPRRGFKRCFIRGPLSIKPLSGGHQVKKSPPRTRYFDRPNGFNSLFFGQPAT